MKSLSIERVVEAPLHAVWKVVSDVDGYAQYAPNIDTSKVISGNGIGMIRECSSKEGRWREACTAWQEQSFYTFHIQTEAPDYPYPFKHLTGRWSVDQVLPERTAIRMRFDVEFNNRFYGWLIFPLMKMKYMKICEQLLDNWQAAIEKEAGSTQSQMDIPV